MLRLTTIIQTYVLSHKIQPMYQDKKVIFIVLDLQTLDF